MHLADEQAFSSIGSKQIRHLKSSGGCEKVVIANIITYFSTFPVILDWIPTPAPIEFTTENVKAPAKAATDVTTITGPAIVPAPTSADPANASIATIDATPKKHSFFILDQADLRTKVIFKFR